MLMLLESALLTAMHEKPLSFSRTLPSRRIVTAQSFSLKSKPRPSAPLVPPSSLGSVGLGASAGLSDGFCSSCRLVVPSAFCSTFTSSPSISALARTVPNNSEMIETSALIAFMTTAGRSVGQPGGFSIRRSLTATPENHENDTSATSHLPRRLLLTSDCTLDRR